MQEQDIRCLECPSEACDTLVAVTTKYLLSDCRKSLIFGQWKVRTFLNNNDTLLLKSFVSALFVKKKQ